MREIVIPGQVGAVERLQLAERNAREGAAVSSGQTFWVMCFDGVEESKLAHEPPAR